MGLPSKLRLIWQGNEKLKIFGLQIPVQYGTLELKGGLPFGKHLPGQ